MKLWYNGQLTDVEDATIPLTWMSPRISSGVFDGARGYWNAREERLYMFRLREHLDRFSQGCRLQKLSHDFDGAALWHAALEVIAANGFREDIYFAPNAFLAVDTTRGGNPNLLTKAEVFMSCRTWPSTLGKKEAIDCGISSWQRIADHSMPPRVKCYANYNNYRLATLEANRHGYPDYFSAIMLNQRGKVAEGAMASLFAIRRDEVVTPSLSSDILESITRDSLMRLFEHDLGLAVAERDVDRTDLYCADEILLCGTGSEIIPVRSVDGHEIGGGRDIGPHTKRVTELFERICRGQTEKYDEWRTPIDP